MHPGRTTSSIEHHRRIDEKAETRASARIPRRLDGHGISRRLHVEHRERIFDAGKCRFLIAKSDFAFNADDPERRKLPVETDIGTDAKRGAIDRFTRDASTRIHEAV